MPHSTSHSTGSHMRATSQSRSSSVRPYAESNGGSGHGETEKFPDFDAGFVFPSGQTTGQRWPQNGAAALSSDRWHARRDSRVKWAPRAPLPASSGHGRSKSSIGNAFRRMRSASVSQNAHDIADALRAPFSWKLIVCDAHCRHSARAIAPC